MMNVTRLAKCHVIPKLWPQRNECKTGKIGSNWTKRSEILINKYDNEKTPRRKKRKKIKVSVRRMFGSRTLFFDISRDGVIFARFFQSRDETSRSSLYLLSKETHGERTEKDFHFHLLLLSSIRKVVTRKK